jgi:aminopeptidase-like protein
MIEFAKKLFPLNRSLTGKGNVKTLKLIKSQLPNLQIKYFSSGEKVFDWKIPMEWNVQDAWLKDSRGKKILNFKENNLVLLGYSKSINKVVNYKILKKNIYTLKSKPNAIPYLTSYYKERWGFCMKHKDYKKLDKNKNFHAYINSSLKKGKMHYGELKIPGKSKNEIFFSTYICHPSMANNEVSGMVLSSFLAKYILEKKNLKYSYRFIFIPETIGSVAYIKKNFSEMKKKIIAGFNITCVGDEGKFSLLFSKDENKLSDRFAKKVFKSKKLNYKKYSWLERGSDERQYCSPLVDLPITTIMKTKFGEYKEYHTSLDKIGTVVTQKGLKESLRIYKILIDEIEKTTIPKSKIICEPFLTKYNLIDTLGAKRKIDKKTRNLLNFVSYCDGKTTLDEISDRCKISRINGYKLFQLLIKKNIITQI